MTDVSSSIGDGRKLAIDLGWGAVDLREKIVSTEGTTLSVARTYIAGENAGVFAAVTKRTSTDPVDSAALYNYHVAGEWGLVADPQEGFTLFNARWIDNNAWYKLHLSQADLGPTVVSEILQALNPLGLFSGKLAQLAEQRKKPTGLLVPVDDALVERLDCWRDQALSFSMGGGNSVDSALQQIYAQLFVLRTVEDRHLDPGVRPVSEALIAPDQINWAKWKRIMKTARERIGGSVFDKDEGRAIPQHVLAGIIQDLYRPVHLPGPTARYDFSWMDTDVLGMAYEKYLAAVLQPSSSAPQVDLFYPPGRNVERVSVRKTKGAYYTPKYITSYLATRAVDEYFSNNEGGEPPFVIDFACGSGAFLVAAVDRVLYYLEQREPSRAWAREIIQSKHIAGIDIDPNAVQLARLRLWQRLLEEPDPLPLPSLFDVVRTGDGLRKETWGPLDRLYDIVLGNPPFLVTKKVEDRDALEVRFATAKGRYDFSSLFVEEAVRVLRVHGFLGLVVPNRFFRNTSGATLRELLARETRLLTIVDFGSTRPFEADAYVGCIVAEKRPIQSQPPRHVKIIEVHHLDVDFLAGLLLAADKGQILNGNVVRMFEARHPVGSSPWLLLSESEQRQRVRLEDSSVRLDSLAIIAQGIRTGANDFFIFEVVSDDGSHFCEVINGLGERAIVEREILRPVVYGSELQRYARVRGERRLLYPYRNGVPLSESELIRSYPRAWEYLNDNRDVLSARSSLIQRNGKFFELVRPRDEAWLIRPKLLIRDLAPRTSFAVDELGSTFLVAGTAVAPLDVDILGGLLAYLNSGFIDEYVRQNTPSFQGDYQKFEPNHLQSIPVLRRFLEDQRFQRALGDLASSIVLGAADDAANRDCERQIDKLILNAVKEAGFA
ncbi:MAG TPA: N-6 DNA methylase [Rhizomicrobium sp.]|jgi:SAM-dependent methyltransferase|nr:N-6 DNA methylase [Rhizomicrobium sp.]